MMHGVNFGNNCRVPWARRDDDGDGIRNGRDSYNNLTGQFTGLFNKVGGFFGRFGKFGFRGHEGLRRGSFGHHRGPIGHHRGQGARPGHYGHPGMGHGPIGKPHYAGAGKPIPIGKPCHRR